MTKALEKVPSKDLSAAHSNSDLSQNPNKNRIMKIKARVNSLGIDPKRVSKLSNDYIQSFDGTAKEQHSYREYKKKAANRNFPKVARPMINHQRLLAKVKRDLNRERSRELSDSKPHPLRDGSLSIDRFETLGSQFHGSIITGEGNSKNETEITTNINKMNILESISGADDLSRVDPLKSSIYDNKWNSNDQQMHIIASNSIFDTRNEFQDMKSKP